jgi:SPP1 family predicted phage head-tail adaptor
MPRAKNRAGSYRHRVFLFSPDTRIPDSKGDFALSYARLDYDWFKIEPLAGATYWLAQQVREDNPVNFTCRYNPNITSQWRLGWEGKIYDILSVNSEEESDRVTVITAVERGIMPDDDGLVQSEISP